MSSATEQHAIDHTDDTDLTGRASSTLRGITGSDVVAEKIKVEKNEVQGYRVEVDIIFVLE